MTIEKTDHFNELLLKILNNEKYYNSEDGRAFKYDLVELFQNLLNDYQPSLDINKLSDKEYNRLGYLLTVSTVFFKKLNKNKFLENAAKTMKVKNLKSTFCHLENEPEENPDVLAKSWNLTNSCHPSDLKSRINFIKKINP